MLGVAVGAEQVAFGGFCQDGLPFAVAALPHVDVELLVRIQSDPFSFH